MSFLRVYIRATMRLTSALHIGTGEEAALGERLLKAINNTRDKRFATWEDCKQSLKVQSQRDGTFGPTGRKNVLLSRRLRFAAFGAGHQGLEN